MNHSDAMTAATVELLQQLIRNACVNDGTPSSGEEVRNADILQSLVTLPGVEIERYEPHPVASRWWHACSAPTRMQTHCC
jgi:hypothetical protein